MDTLQAISSRSTVPQVKMAGPGPSDAELARILEAGAAAPDHGRLRPWRFLIVQGEGRRELGGLFERALLKANPDASPEEIEKQRTGPLRAPLIIIVAAALSDSRAREKIPAVERIASAAAAAQNMLLAAWNEGIASCPNGIADREAAHAALQLGEGETPVIVLTFGLPERVRDPESRAAEDWSARANRRPLDDVVRRLA